MTLLRVRFGRDSPATGAFDWALVEDDGTFHDAGSAPGRAPPAAAACELVIASELVLVERIRSPAAQRRRIASALRFAVEESAIPDPEKLHVAAAATGGGDSLSVGIIDRQWLVQALAQLERYGLTPLRAYPEFLACELPPRAWSVVWAGDDSFARVDVAAGLALDAGGADGVPVGLRLALAEARAARAAPERLMVTVAPGAAPAPDPARWQAALGVPIELAGEWQWWQGRSAPPLNLLAGEFSPSAMRRDWADLLRRPAALAAVLLGVSLAGVLLDWAVKARERSAIAGEMTSLYRATFGERATILDAPLQMKRALEQARREAGALARDDYLALLGQVSAALVDPARHRVDAMDYGSGALRLTVRVGDPAAFRAAVAEMRARLPLPGLEVALAADESASRVTVHAAPASGAAR